MEMEDCHLCFLLIICTWFTFAITDLRVNITSGSGVLSMTGALHECAAKNARLARAWDFRGNTSYVKPGKSYWSGSFPSPWISFVGCYQQVSDIDLTKVTMSAYIRDENDDVIPAICQRISGCENYFGIENDNCICVEDIYTADWGNVKDQQCTSLWRGGRQEENRYFTFYKKNALIRENSGLCGYFDTTKDIKSVFRGLKCDVNYKMLCNDKKWTESAGSWNKGITACWDKSHVFPAVILTDSNIGSKKYGWFGAFKRVAPLPKAETVNDSEAHFLMKLENGKVIEQRERYNSGTAEFFCVTVVVGEKEVTIATDLPTQTSTEETSTRQIVQNTSMSSVVTSLTAETSIEEEGQSQMTNIGLIIGTSLGALLLVGVTATVVICKRKHQKQKNQYFTENVAYISANQTGGDHMNQSNDEYIIVY